MWDIKNLHFSLSKTYITGQFPGFHCVHGLLVDARVFIVALHVAGVLLFVLVLLKI